MARRIYADYNASAPLKPSVKEALAKAMELVGNPSSIHQFGREASGHLEETRRVLARKVEAKPQDVVFTSGATEANNMVLTSAKGHGFDVLISAVEHESVRSCAPEATVVPVTSEGLLDLNALKEALKKRTGKKALLSVMVANNETGILQPLKEISKLCEEYGVALHIDAVQALGKLPFSFDALKCTSMTFSSHKIGGPAGVGALVVRSGFPLDALILGGGQEKGRRSGTPNILGIIGFGAALQDLEEKAWLRVMKLREMFEEELTRRTPEVSIVGNGVTRLPNTTCVLVPGVPADLLLMNLDLQGIAVSSGAACSSGKVKTSHVLLAMGYNPDLAASSLRFSFDPDLQESDIQRILEVWTPLVHRFMKKDTYIIKDIEHVSSKA